MAGVHSADDAGPAISRSLAAFEVVPPVDPNSQVLGELRLAAMANEAHHLSQVDAALRHWTPRNSLGHYLNQPPMRAATMAAANVASAPIAAPIT